MLKIYNPLFALLLVLLQTVITVIKYYYYVSWGKQFPDLDAIISRVFDEHEFLLFIIVIGLLEVTQQKSKAKIFIRALMVLLIILNAFAYLIPVEGIIYGVHNVAAIISLICLGLLIRRITQTYKQKKAKTNS